MNIERQRHNTGARPRPQGGDGRSGVPCLLRMAEAEAVFPPAEPMLDTANGLGGP